MASYMRALVIGSNTGTPVRDNITNTVYFKHNLWPTGEPADWNTLATDIANAFNAANDFFRDCNSINVRMYSMEDPEPRRIRGQKTVARTFIASGAREVALCLSYRGERNLPRERGRMFLGPLSGQSNPRPSGSLLSSAIALAQALANIGGTDIDWCVYSPTTYEATQNYGDAFKPVQQAWCDDEWDVQRSRGLRATTRQTLSLSE